MQHNWGTAGPQRTGIKPATGPKAQNWSGAKRLGILVRVQIEATPSNGRSLSKHRPIEGGVRKKDPEEAWLREGPTLPPKGGDWGLEGGTPLAALRTLPSHPKNNWRCGKIKHINIIHIHIYILLVYIYVDKN